MSTLFTFPGQGSQLPGMLHALPDHPEISRTLAETGDALGRNPRGLDHVDALGSTVAVQLCLLVAGVALARALTAEGAAPTMVAGMSVGAFPAAVVAGALDYRDALHLVALRGQLMERSFPSGFGMTAVIGLERHQLAALVGQVHAGAAPVYLANQNAERQLVIAGADAAMQAVGELALRKGATRTERLDVAVPSHCPLLEPAARALAEALSEVRLKPPRVTYLSSSAVRAIHDPARLAEDLASNMARPVNWHDTARLAWERGARLAVEMPSGSVLTGLTQSAFAEGLAVCSENNRIETLISLITRQ